MKTIKNFWADETGLELSEYAVAAALVAGGVALAAFTGLGRAVALRIAALALAIAFGNPGPRV
jgi:Flp pilus assembly pilin Flp